jgi:DNA repair exonuclease SbcCD ATPase subunit
MSGQNYMNYYVEILTGTMTDAIIRNVSLQATVRSNEEIINEQVSRLEQLQSVIDNSSHEKTINDLRNEYTTRLEQLQSIIDNNNSSYEKTINDLRNELNNVRNELNQLENIKHQAQHVDTFRNELIKERELHKQTHDDYESKIVELNKKIEYLQLTPAKRKKIDDANNLLRVLEAPPTVDETIKDGGVF